MAQQIRQAYAPLFEASHEPHRETAENLRNLFNIHSSGAAATIELQIQTFRALCDYADFGALLPAAAQDSGAPAGTGRGTRAQGSPPADGVTGPSLHIDLHIHLPEGKSTRDYQYIIQDIAKYLYGQADADMGRREE